MPSKKIIMILIYLTVISGFLVFSMASNNSLNANKNCDTSGCHSAPGSIGHVDYNVVLTGSQIVQSGNTATITATVTNNAYPFQTVSLSLQPSSLYSISGGGSATIQVGALDRGASKTESWNLLFKSSTDTSVNVQVDFSAFAYAASHMQYTFQNTYSKGVFISTKPTPILQVQSNPLTESTLFIGSSNNTGKLTITNAGKVNMTNVHVTTSGPVLVNNETNFTIPYIPALGSETYPIHIDTSQSGTATITVIYNGVQVQEAVLNIYLRPNPADSFTLFLGRVFGYVAYVLLFLSVVCGAGIYHLKKYISGRKIRILHSDLANLSFTMVIIHAIILTIPNSPWANSYMFFELIPERIPTDIGALGLALGRSALVLMYISVFSGFYLAKLIKRYGKRVGISIHMLSYVALIFGFLHTIILGGWAKAYPIIGLMMFVSVLSIGFLKYDAQMMLNRKKKEYKQRQALKALRSAQEPTTVEQ